jgi:hypothetical protein
MRRIIVAAILTLSASYAACAQNAPCSDPQDKRALAETDSLRTWDALYRSYEKYRACDDGAIAEGYSEAVARLLADHWETLPRLIALKMREPRFWRFVLKHIDATDDSGDLEKIRLNSTKHCAAELNSACASIERAAEVAIRESND